MSDIYRKVGRGGAGNYYSKKDIADATKNSSDLESQTSSHTKGPNTTSHGHAPEYQHTGRGGAGNWVQPAELQSHGLAQQSEDIHSTETTRPAEAPVQRVMGSSKPTYRGGRGGAGNYFDDGEEARRLEEEKVEEERRKREVQGKVEEDVERGLKKPERAYSGN
ncbi:hypothetical protein ONS95_014886 [Cadophora gregata]|uniref:uncharacterized protein n=1 Tax=Cadophora gregata TaxID=51156 RepID=UPI0026DAC18A|nr:uncharacterized protein ONS95_014886 [Cadophora gregata]KAK0113188.1 hypothetical protein ONS95_014886 [Cadophora gregata]KAK0125232.1 hypothetical protein ONS96_009089 [Cadophora gregata f. sp. sojae]